MVGEHPFDGIGNVPTPAAHVGRAGKELEPDGPGPPDVAHVGKGGVGHRADPAREVPRRAHAVTAKTDAGEIPVAHGVFHHFPVVGHEDDRRLPEGVEIGIRITLPYFKRVDAGGDVFPLRLRVEDASPGIAVELLRDVGRKSAAVPFAPVPVAAEIEAGE